MAGIIKSDIEETPFFQEKANIYKSQPIPYLTETGEVGYRDYTVNDIFMSASPSGDIPDLERFVLQQFVQDLQDGVIPRKELERQLNRTISDAELTALRNDKENEINLQFIADYGSAPLAQASIPEQVQTGFSSFFDRMGSEDPTQRERRIERLGGYPLPRTPKTTSPADIRALQQGIDPSKYLTGVLGQSISERYLNSDETLINDLDVNPQGIINPGVELAARVIPTASSPVLLKRMVSFQNPNRKQLKELYGDLDPNARFIKFIDPKDPKNPKAPWAIISPTITGSDEPVLLDALNTFDPRYRSDWESFKGPFVDEVTKFFGQEILPEITGLAPATLLGRKFAKNMKQQIDKWIVDIDTGKLKAIEKDPGSIVRKVLGGTGKALGYASLIGMGTAISRFAQLAYAEKMGIHSNMDLAHALNDSGMVAIWAALPQAIGEAAIRSFQYGYRNWTGREIPENVINEALVSAAQGKARRKEIEDQDLDYSPEEINEVFSQFSKNFVEDTKISPIDNMDDYQQRLLLNLISTMDESNPKRVAIESVFRRQGKALTQLYEQLVQKSRLQNQEVPSLDEFQRIFNDLEIKGKERDIELRSERLAQDTQVEEVLEEALPSNVSPEMTLEEAVLSQQQINPPFPETKNVLLMERSERLTAADDELDLVLEGYRDVSNPNFREYIAEPISNIGVGRSRISRSANVEDASKVAKQVFPSNSPFIKEYNDEVLRLIETKQLPEDSPTLGAFALLTRDIPEGYPEFNFSVADAVELKLDLQITSAQSTNPEVKNKFNSVIEGLNEFIVDTLPEGESDEIFNAIAARDYEVFKSIDSKELYDLARTDLEQIPFVLLGKPPEKIEKLISFINTMDDGPTRVLAVQSGILDRLKTEMASLPNAAQKNARFKEYFKEYGPQMEVLFPDNKFRTFNAFLDTAENRILKDVEAIEKAQLEIESLASWNAILEGIEEGAITEKGVLAALPNKNQLKTIPNFIEIFINRPEASTGFVLSAARKDLENLSKLADKNPVLRTMMQDAYFQSMRQLLEKSGFERAFQPEQVLRGDAGFNIEQLTRQVSNPYTSGKKGSQEFARDLELILGKDIAQEYSKNLRIFEQELKKAQQIIQDPSGPGSLNQTTAQGKIREESRTFSRLAIGPLSPTGRKLNVIFDGLGERGQNVLADILMDPNKLDEFVQFKLSQKNNREILRYIIQISLNPTEEMGNEGNLDSIGKELSGMRQDVRELIGMATGGSVSSALAQAEARNKQLRRGVS